MARFLSPALVLAVLSGCSGGSGDKPSAMGDETAAGKDKDELVLPGGPPSKGGETAKGADQQTVQFLNSQGTGRHFCIIADHSNSLGDASLDLIKREIGKTLGSLDERSRFHVMFFAKEPLPMPGGGWLRGNKENVDKVAAWMSGVHRNLGTVPAPAFRQAFALEPRPDVIFFMTDGLLHPPGKAPALIAELNRKEPKVPINTILFTRTAAAVPPENRARADLETIARDSGGKFHQFVDPDALPKKKKKG